MTIGKVASTGRGRAERNANGVGTALTLAFALVIVGAQVANSRTLKIVSVDTLVTGKLHWI